MTEGGIPSKYIHMGSKYKKKFEREWDGKSLDEMRIKTLQIQADKNINAVCKGKFRRRGR